MNTMNISIMTYGRTQGVGLLSPPETMKVILSTPSVFSSNITETANSLRLSDAYMRH